ncbi:hypothetical protein M422DRAFT_270472 [Sphaerobolus stellatus SS14]|uniref:Uncharacterized protein n=1 Tax=Sphaerobolus stellatus (strain SS14) TaxID=990650 RepID=A0A0C9USA5_SPHS4|nr:hypothetical protein M422DRAFT_270472 [Sphaerobolus stellatus SS14]
MEYATQFKNINLIATENNATTNGTDNDGKSDVVELKAFGVVGFVFPAVMALSTLASFHGCVIGDPASIRICQID